MESCALRKLSGIILREERASPLVFSARFRFAMFIPIPLFPRDSLPSSERLRSYLHKRYLPTASADRKKNTIHEITHALNEAWWL